MQEFGCFEIKNLVLVGVDNCAVEGSDFGGYLV